MLEGTTPINTPKHNFKNFDEARSWAKENIVGTYKNENTGEDMRISNKVIGKYLSQKAVDKSMSKDAHLSTLMQLPKLIKVSILKESKPDEKNSRNIKEVQRLYGAINYNGRIYPVKITVKAFRDEINSVYSYEVIKTENPNEHMEHSGNLPVGTSEAATPNGLVTSLLQGSSISSGQWNASTPQRLYTPTHSDNHPERNLSDRIPKKADLHPLNNQEF